jgi:hypothetical protein
MPRPVTLEQNRFRFFSRMLSRVLFRNAVTYYHSILLKAGKITNFFTDFSVGTMQRYDAPRE